MLEEPAEALAASDLAITDHLAWRRPAERPVAQRLVRTLDVVVLQELEDEVP